MQSQQIPPDFSIGFGTEVENVGGCQLAGAVFLALVIAVCIYFAWRGKAKKR